MRAMVTAYEALVRGLDVKVWETFLSTMEPAPASSPPPDNQGTLETLGAKVAIDYARQDAAEVALDG